VSSLKREPHQPDEPFEAVLREAHRRARRVAYSFNDFRKYLYENPTKTAENLLSIVPKEMDALERKAWACFRYDLGKRRKGQGFALEDWH
jgi:hypothetical protein